MDDEFAGSEKWGTMAGGCGRGGGAVASLVALSFGHGNSADGALVFFNIFYFYFIAVCFCFQSFKIKSF